MPAKPLIGELISVLGVGWATRVGVEKAAELEVYRHRGYLSTSGVELRLSKAARLVEERGLNVSSGFRHPPLIVINAPPGVGKTYTLVRLLEAVRRTGGALGYRFPLAYYLAPFKTILEDVRRIYARIVDGYDPSRPDREHFYLLYRSPRDCPHARRYRDVIELWGSEEIACQLCPYAARASLSGDARSVKRLIYRVVVEEGRARDAPIIDVLPRGEGVCLRRLAVQLALAMPSLRSKRRAGIAGLIGSFNSVLNPGYAKLWMELRPADTPKLIIMDEFDMLITEPVVVSELIPVDLYPSEKEVLNSTIGVSTYKRILELVERLADNPLGHLLNEKGYDYSPLRALTGDAVREACRRCREVVLERGEYCRLCNALRTLSYIAYFILRSVEAGCSPVYVNELFSGGRCLDHALILSASREEGWLRVSARPVFFIARLLLDPFYPSISAKILASATADIIYVDPYSPASGVLTGGGGDGGRYGAAIYVDVYARYKYLIVRLHRPLHEVVEALMASPASIMAALIGVDTSGTPEGRERLILTRAVDSSCILIGDLVEQSMGSRGLLFTNSKVNAEIASVYVRAYLESRGLPAYISRTEDYIRVASRDVEVYVTWFRSRISRGVSEFRDARAAAAILVQSDPPVETSSLHHMYKQVASTIQSLFRIVRSLTPGRRYFILYDFVWDMLVSKGPGWLRSAPADVEYVDQSSSYRNPARDACLAIRERIESMVKNVFKHVS